MEIAVYGKGGIGKSTVSANFSAALSLAGNRVLQIGCDPKHDSTRLLMHGEMIPTVLEYLKDTPREKEETGKVLKTGFNGIGCIEAGGPKPGVGCAGRGIISAFEFLDRHHVKESYDTVVYDVLGDVVCGGFAVPVRREYADAVFLVTSGEYMAIYAANNILRGIRNFDADKYCRVAGIIYNERKLPDEDGRVKRFAQAAGLPICAKVPRSSGFAEAEEKNETLMELEGYGEEKAVFENLASLTVSGFPLYPASPLEDEELERAVLNIRKAQGRGWGKNEGISEESPLKGEDEEEDFEYLKEKEELSQGPERAPLYGCAFNGAATQAVHLTDAVIIGHCPRACAFYTWQNISSPGRKNLFNRGILMPSAISPNFESTDMGHAEAVFGGMDKLKEKVREAVERKPGAVVVISSCVSGIIGDDIKDIESMSSPDVPVIAMAADGDINGDYMEGIRMCLYTLADTLIDKNVKPEGKRVNLVYEPGVSNNRSLNYEIIKNMLSWLEISINCRFLGDASVGEVKNFLAAPLNILADTGQDGQDLKNYLTEKFGCRFLEGSLPVGFKASEEFLLKLGDFFGCRSKALEAIEKEREEYKSRLEALRPLLSGKKVLLTTINSDLDWIIEAAHAAGMEFVWVGVLNYLNRKINVTSHSEYLGRVEEYTDIKVINERIREYKPDLVLSNYTSMAEAGDYIVDSIPMIPAAGFYSALHVMERWAGLFGKGKKREGGWKHDRELFEKYHS